MTQFHELRMRQLHELGLRQTKADVASNRGACDATNGVAARQTTPIVNNGFPNLSAQHVGLLPTQAAKNADADKKRAADVACEKMTIAEPHAKRLKQAGTHE